MCRPNLDVYSGLAARYGDPAGLGVHMGPESARYLWLDRASRAGRG